MQEIAFWLRQLIIVLILAGFLELILPDNQLKGVAKLMMGLLIILLIIQPIAQLMRLPMRVAWLTPTKISRSSTTQKVIDDGLKLQKSWQREFSMEKRNFWEQKIKQVTNLVTGVKVEKVAVSCDGNNPVLVRLWASPSSSQREYWWRKDVEQRLKNGVGLVTDLTEEKIEVSWNE